MTRSECHHPVIGSPAVERDGVWDPWWTLRDHPELLYDLVDLEPGEGRGFYWPLTTGEAVIGVGRHLDQRERRAVLGHELLHHRRGGGRACAGMSNMWDAVIARDEESIEDELAIRLVPLEQLRVLLLAQDDFGYQPDLWEIADEFGVPERVAARAVTLLGQEQYGDRRAG